MLRSLIAHVFFLFAIASIPLASAQSARAEIPFEGWLRVAADSLDQQIDKQIKLSWQPLNLVGQRTAELFDRMGDQCRMGFAGSRGVQLVRVFDLLVELRGSGVTGVVAPKKNWNFPAENFELQRYRVVQSDLRSQSGLQSHPNRELNAALGAPVSAAVVEDIVVLGHGSADRPLLQFDQLAQLATQAEEAMIKLGESLYRPALTASRAWNRLIATSTAPNRAESFASQMENEALDTSIESLRVYWECYSTCDRWQISLAPPAVNTPKKSSSTSTLSRESRTFGPKVLMSYYVEMSNFAQAKLNWLTSKVRHIAEACLKNIEPQLLTLELDYVKSHHPGAEVQWKFPSHPSVAELPYSTR